MPEPTETPRRSGGRIPTVVLAATLAFGVLAGVWSVVAPLGEAPDEPAHLALVWHLAEGKPYPDYDGLHNQQAIITLCKTFASATRACPRDGEPVTHTSMRRHPIEEARDKADRPAWNDEGGDTRLSQLNQMPQHPPLYYQAMATVLRVERAVFGGPWSADRELALLRLVNALLIMPLPLLAWWAAKRFGLSDPTAVTASVSLFAVPMLTHIGSTLNNDNLLTLLCAVVLALCAGVVRGDRSLRTALAIGVATGLALLTKAFAATLPPVILLAYVVGMVELAGERWVDRIREVIRPLLVAGGSVLVLAGWWYVGVRIRSGRFAPSTETSNLTSDLQPPGFVPSAEAFAREFSRNLNTRFWGSFGWYTIRFPSWLALLCTVVVLAAVVTALVPRRDEGGSTRLQRAFLLVPFLLLFGFVLVRAWNLYVITSIYPFIQGRYLFAGIVGLLVLAAIGVHRWAGRWAPVVVAVLALAIQLEALRRCVQGWWGGPGLGPRGQLRAMVAWSAWPGEALGLLALVALGAGAWFAWELGRSVRGEAVLGSEEDRPVGSIAT